MRYLLSTLTLLLIAAASYSQCTPSFTPVQASASGNNLLVVALTSISSPATTHTKHFTVYWGDGSSQNSTGFVWSTHTYAAPGTYTIKMVLTHADSANNTIYCIDSSSKSITINYQSCATTINATVNTQNNGQVTFTANTPGATSYMTYIWLYGDGTSDTTLNNTISHTYGYSGNFNVQLIARDSNNTCQYTNSTMVTVLNGCGQANFSYNANGLAVNFYNSSSYLNGYSESASWDFGDGSTSTLYYPTHTYATSGTYNTKLITTWYDSSNNIVYCSDTITKPVTVSGTNSGAYKITGNILVDSGLSLPQVYRVWLIVYDSTAQFLAAIDTLTVTNSAGAVSTPYTFNNVMPGIYRVKAKLMNAQAQNTGYVPTYHDSALLWNNATLIYQTASGSIGKDIDMQHGTPTTGPGFIGGSVNQGANKGTANGIPDMPVYLVDMNDKLLQYVETDASGSYSFSDIPTGTYKIYPEEMSYITTPAVVTLTSTSTSLGNIYFERSHAQKTITPIPTGINDIDSDNTFALYPNPASQSVSVNWNGAHVANIIITDITGKQILTSSLAANSTKQIDISTLTKGLYFVTVECNGQKTTQKLLIQ